MEDPTQRKQRCIAVRETTLTRTGDAEQARLAYEKCMGEGETDTTKPSPKLTGSPCEAGGYLGKQISRAPGQYVLLTPCKEGHTPKKAEDGKIWCCKKPEVPNGENGENGEDETGETCTGGYKLADKPISAGKGSIWSDEIIKPEHGFYRDPNTSAHWLHKGGKWYHRPDIVAAIQAGTLADLTGQEGGMCQKGYQPQTINGEQWCCPVAATEGTQPGGEFAFSPELMNMLEMLRGRFSHLMDYPRGTTPEERQAIINFMTQGIRRGERGRLQSTRDLLSRMGLFGSGIQLKEEAGVRRGTRELMAQAREKVATDEIDRRFRELMETTGLSSNIFNIVAMIEQMQESLSAGRRGEGRESMNQLLAYLSLIMGGGNNSYWQALLNYMMQNEGEGDIWDWLPYAGYLV